MELCSYNHDEVCHEERNCPMCELIEEHAKELREITMERDSLNDEIESTLEELNTLRHIEKRLMEM